MRATRRYWSALVLGGFLAGFAAAADRPLLLVGAGALGGWLLAAQFLFVRRVRRTIDGLSVEQSSARARIVEGDIATVTMAASLSRPSPLSLRFELNPPVGVTDVDARGRRCRIERGDRGTSTTVRTTGSIAGRHRFAPPSIALTDALGLFEETVERGEDLSIDVAPRAPRQLHVGSGGDREIAAYGDHDTSMRGDGLEPIELRQYIYGDDLSRIDWKATARLNQPHIREYEVDTSRRTVMLIDHRNAMAEGRDGERKLDYAREVGLAFLNSAQAYNDPVALYAVGDEGLTVERDLESRTDQYVEIRERLYELSPTPAAGADTATTVRPARAGRLAQRFSAESTPMERILRPYFAATANYVRRLESRPLFSAARVHVSNRAGTVWTVIFTDDTDRAEVRETVKLARLDGRYVMVFLTPTVLFELGAFDDLDESYRRYRDFERFRRGLASLDRVSAFEVGPGDRLAAVIGSGRGRRAAPVDGAAGRAAEPRRRPGNDEREAKADPGGEPVDGGSGDRSDDRRNRRGVR